MYKCILEYVEHYTHLWFDTFTEDKLSNEHAEKYMQRPIEELEDVLENISCGL